MLPVGGSNNQSGPLVLRLHFIVIEFSRHGIRGVKFKKFFNKEEIGLIELQMWLLGVCACVCWGENTGRYLALTGSRKRQFYSAAVDVLAEGFCTLTGHHFFLSPAISNQHCPPNLEIFHRLTNQLLVQRSTFSPRERLALETRVQTHVEQMLSWDSAVLLLPINALPNPSRGSAPCSSNDV